MSPTPMSYGPVLPLGPTWFGVGLEDQDLPMHLCTPWLIHMFVELNHWCCAWPRLLSWWGEELKEYLGVQTNK